MRKSLLKDIPVRELAGREVEKGIDYIVSAHTVSLSSESVLVVTFYSAVAGLPCFRVFATHEDFISFDFVSSKWSDTTIKTKFEDAKLEHCLMKNYSYDSAESIISGSMFFEATDDTVTALDKFQQNLRQRVREKQLEKKHTVVRDRINAVMNQVQPLPENIQDWVDSVPLKKSRYIYYRKKEGSIHGYCTSCKMDVILGKAKHNSTGICPYCHKKATIKAVGLSTQIYDDAYFDYIQKIKGGILIRTLYVIKIYNDFRNPEYRYFEEFRNALMENGKIQGYIENHQFEFLDGWRYYTKSDSFHYIYTHNLGQVLRNTSWQYCQISKFATRYPELPVAGYLNTYYKNPCIEYLVKLSLYHLVAEKLGLYDSYHSRNSVDFGGKKLNEVLGVPKEMIAILQKADVTTGELEVVQSAYQLSRSVTAEDIIWLRNNLCVNRRFTHNSEIIYLMQFISLAGIIRYLQKQMFKIGELELRNSKTFYDLLITWRDYVEYAVDLDYNFKRDSNLLPPDLLKAHNKIMWVSSIRHMEEDIVAISGMSEKLNATYHFEDMGLCVRSPRSVDEIIQEGSELLQCVASYIDKMAEGTTTILFIRREEEPEKPFYTIEIRDGAIRQIYGFDNCGTTQEVQGFVDQWQAKKLTSSWDDRIAA